MMIAVGATAAGQTSRGIPRQNSHAQRSISTVDWYKEPPKHLNTSGAVLIINDLCMPVANHLRLEATALLGRTDVVEITREQASHFGFQADPDSVLRSLIRQSAKEIRETQQWLADAKAGRGRLRYSPREAEEIAQEQQPLIKEKKADIREYQQWLGRLKPYLIRGVSLEGYGENFSGYLTAKDFVLVFGSVLEKGRPLKIKNTPVVVYLPWKPSRVFTEMRNLD